MGGFWILQHMRHKKLCAAFIGGMILLIFGAAFPQSSWQRVDVGTDMLLNSVFFLNQDVGWFGGGTCPQDSSFFRTTDGGQTWQYISILPPCDGAAGIFFINQLHGFVVGGQSSWESTDGGVTWQQFPLGFGNMNAMTFSDSLNGWMVGDYDGFEKLRIFHTSDGGANWERQTAPGDLVILSDIAFADSLNGWTCGGATLHTTDGGKNWNYQSPLPGHGIDKISALSPSNAWGISVVDVQYARFTYDSGSTWQERIFTLDDQFLPEDIMFADSLHGWIVGNTFVSGQGLAMSTYHTTDGGATWAEEARGLYGRGLFAVHAIDSGHVWAVGFDGSVVNYGYVTSGVDDPDGKPVPKDYTLSQNYPNPFNVRTLIQFNLRRSGKIELSIFNLRGERVKTLLDTFTTAGIHRLDWDGTDGVGRVLPSGVYIYRLKATDFSEAKKMILLK